MDYAGLGAPRLKISPPEWLNNDKGLNALLAALGHGNALIVGGAVRAAVLGEGVGDIDIATVFSPDEVLARLDGRGFKIVPTGIEHGTLTVVVDGKGYEVTTLRRDVATDGRRAVVAFSDNWAEDAARRDLTINTLFMDNTGYVYDPIGVGVNDLQTGVVRFVGKADARIKEDYLRILRYFRFYARYGKVVPDAEAYKACGQNAQSVASLSRERITHELERLLFEKNAAHAIEVMRQGGVLSDFWSPEFNEKLYTCLRDFVKYLPEKQQKNILFAYSVWRNKIENVQTILPKYLVLSKGQKTFLKNLSACCSNYTENQYKNLYFYGLDAALCGLLFSFLNSKLSFDIERFFVEGEKLLNMAVPELPFKPRDVMDILCLEQGPEVGRIIKLVEAWWLDQDASPDKEACLNYAKTLL